MVAPKDSYNQISSDLAEKINMLLITFSNEGVHDPGIYVK